MQPANMSIGYCELRSSRHSNSGDSRDVFSSFDNNTDHASEVIIIVKYSFLRVYSLLTNWSQVNCHGPICRPQMNLKQQLHNNQLLNVKKMLSLFKIVPQKIDHQLLNLRQWLKTR